MNTPGRKNVCSKSTIETPEQTVNILEVHGFSWEFEEFGNLNMHFQTGLNLTSCEFICKSNIYIFHFFNSFLEIVHLELYFGSFKYPANIYLFKLNNRHARTRCGMYSALVTKTSSRRSGVFIGNFERI